MQCAGSPAVLLLFGKKNSLKAKGVRFFNARFKRADWFDMAGQTYFSQCQ
jgi:hypothetical protein